MKNRLQIVGAGNLIHVYISTWNFLCAKQLKNEFLIMQMQILHIVVSICINTVSVTEMNNPFLIPTNLLVCSEYTTRAGHVPTF